ncbi:MAG: hypothetical protein Unbinned6224contig1003_30 [Prokaryotic dsDNA virus sp.]|nr:MAG: hypothetical protein Unbinned6224contig1003_30 [Prokaryotic dsDNA virus sp.]|tara:strand:- start:14628 stop:14957 length:330 start_codon:yes stop_codon:yes gene_type:complete
MGTEYKDITSKRNNDTVKTIQVKQFAGGKDFDGVGIQLTTNAEENWKNKERPWEAQYIQFSRQDIPAIVKALQSYYDNEYPTLLQDNYEKSHFNGTCECNCSERDEIES